MRQALRISGLAALATGPLAACSPQPADAQPCYGKSTVIGGQPACVMLIHEAGSRAFGAFVAPLTVSRDKATEAVMAEAQALCGREYGLRAGRNLAVQGGGWAAPGTWRITGSCI